MELSPPARAPTLVPFRCIFCASEQAVNIVLVARNGATACGACKRSLNRAQVSEGIARIQRPAASGPARRGGRLWA